MADPVATAALARMPRAYQHQAAPTDDPAVNWRFLHDNPWPGDSYQCPKTMETTLWFVFQWFILLALPGMMGYAALLVLPLRAVLPPVWTPNWFFSGSYNGDWQSYGHSQPGENPWQLYERYRSATGHPGQAPAGRGRPVARPDSDHRVSGQDAP